MDSKYIPQNKLPSLIKSLRKSKKKIVFTNGCFDLLHPGHIKLLKAAKQSGDILILAINSDKSIKKIKGNLRPILNQKHRIEVLSAVTYVDYIIIFTESTPLKVIKKIKPDVLVKGADWPKKDIVGYSLLKKLGKSIITVPLKKNLSTSYIIKKIRKTYG